MLSPFERLVECFPDAIAIQQGGRLVYVNPAAAKMLGYGGVEDLELVEWADLVPPGELEAAVAEVRAALDAPEGTMFPSSQRRAVKKSGETLPVEVTVVRVTWHGAPALAVVAQDRTERERVESGMAQADRMAAVGTLAAGVAHEINNPLAYVAANIAFASERIAGLTPSNLEASRGAISEALDEARQGAERVGQVVSDLKTFTKSEERIDLVDLAEVLDSTVKMAASSIRHRARLVIERAPTPRVQGRASRLAQVVLNLLVNASQAIEEGASDAVVTVRLGTTADGRASLEIEDTGAGIAPETLAHVFEPFFTTKPFGVGTGLGLAVCKNIVEEHGGTIAIDSAPGRGTRVRVELPAAPSGFVPHHSSSTMHAVRPRRFNVLLVDDDPLVLRALARLLGAHKVTTAAGGKAALDLLAQHSDFDVILCDLMMPDVTGMDLYEELVRWGSGLERRIVFASGGAVTDRARDLLERVPNLRLEKPLDRAEVEEALILAVEAATR